VLEFGLLGPLELRRRGLSISLGGARQRALLALLCLEHGEAVSVDRIVDALWGESPPATARHMVEVYISKLRKLLGASLLLTRAPGYALELDPECLDVTRFERLLAEGREALAHDEPDLAARRLGEALALWRGQALADLSYAPFARAEAARLADLRQYAEEERIDAELALGRAGELVGEIEGLVAAQPLRERRHGQLMLALYRAGRQADALAAYRRARETLVDELGIEPGPDLQAIERAILNQDGALRPLAPRPRSETESEERPEPVTSFKQFVRARRAIFGAALGALLISGVAILVFALGREGSERGEPPPAPVNVAANSVAVIDPDTAEVTADVPVGETPGPVAFGSGSVWVGNFDDKTLSRIEPSTHQVTTIGIGIKPYGLAVGAGGVWMSNQGQGLERRASMSLLRIATGRIDTIEIGDGYPYGGDSDPRGAPVLVGREMPVLVAAGAVWTGRRYFGDLIKIEPTFWGEHASYKIAKRAEFVDPGGMAFAAGSLWVVNPLEGTVTRVDPVTGHVVKAIQVGERPCCVAVNDEAIWVVSARTEVWKISPRTNSVEGTVSVGSIPVAIAADDEAVWVANYGDHSISRIDSQSNQVTTKTLGRPPVGIAVGGGAVWVAVD
jgi:YVTN family beta-propeller protein